MKVIKYIVKDKIELCDEVNADINKMLVNNDAHLKVT